MDLPERGETGSGDAVFTAEQLDQVTMAVREVMDRSGYGEVRIVIQWRRVHSIVVATQLKIDR